MNKYRKSFILDIVSQLIGNGYNVVLGETDEKHLRLSVIHLDSGQGVTNVFEDVSKEDPDVLVKQVKQFFEEETARKDVV